MLNFKLNRMLVYMILVIDLMSNPFSKQNSISLMFKDKNYEE